MNKTNQQLQQLQVLQKYATKKGREVLFPKKPQPFVCLSPPMIIFFYTETFSHQFDNICFNKLLGIFFYCLFLLFILVIHKTLTLYIVFNFGITILRAYVKLHKHILMH